MGNKEKAQKAAKRMIQEADKYKINLPKKKK